MEHHGENKAAFFGGAVHFQRRCQRVCAGLVAQDVLAVGKSLHHQRRVSLVRGDHQHGVKLFCIVVQLVGAGAHPYRIRQGILCPLLRPGAAADHGGQAQCPRFSFCDHLGILAPHDPGANNGCAYFLHDAPSCFSTMYFVIVENRKSTFRMKASPGRGKLSPQVTDEGAAAEITPHPSAHCVRSHLPPKG